MSQKILYIIKLIVSNNVHGKLVFYYLRELAYVLL